MSTPNSSTGSPASAPDERALVAALKDGDEAAFERVVREHGPRMLGVIRRILRDEEDSDDALQEAFVSAFRALERFDGGSRLGTWLHRIAVNAALMRVRKRKARPESSIEDFLPEFLENGHWARERPAWTDTADVLLEKKQSRERVRALIDLLPENYRNVLLLRDIEELSGSEAAALLEISVNAVKIRLHRARQALRELLDAEIAGERR